MGDYLLAIDQGTSSTRAIVFSRKGEVLSQHQVDLTQFYPQEGWVEQDPEEMWLNTLQCCREALKKIHLTAKDIAAAGITNQRETTIIWDKVTGRPIHRAIVWQDRRTSELCQTLSQHKINASLQDKTGLLLDPYFSATKIIWLLNSIPGARDRAERGELLFGTVDTFLLWRLTKGSVHATDATNASRTLLFNIRTQKWDKEILEAFQIPENLLPIVLDSNAQFGKINAEFFGTEIPITGIAGDQQAATVGQACFSEGMVKSTYGTGGFMLLNTGSQMVLSKNRLLATIAYRLNGIVTYGLEGSIFSAGSTVKWLRDKLKIIKSAGETETLAQSISHNGGVYLIPAFNGLGAPYWKPDAHAAIIGLTQKSGVAEIARAALEAVAYQTLDLLNAMIGDYTSDSMVGTLRFTHPTLDRGRVGKAQRAHHVASDSVPILRVDGGMTENNWLLQFLANLLNIEIHRPVCTETTALGVAYLAGLGIGMYQSLEEISNLWQMNDKFIPTMENDERNNLYDSWKKALVVLRLDRRIQ